MRRLTVALVLSLVLGLTAGPALAGNAHFVGTPTVTRSGNTLTVSGKVAGLGSESQIQVTISADAACLNPGGNFPEAENKETFTASALVPVQNGKANFRLTLTATFQPRCAPPMSVVFGPVTVEVCPDPDDVTPTFSCFSTTISGPGPGGTF